MRNYIKPGEIMTYTAPVGGVTSGGGYMIGALFVVATNTIDAGLPFEGLTCGVVQIAKATGEGALAEGAPVFWDVANARVTIDSAAGMPIGTVGTAAASADTTAWVKLHGVSMAGRTLSVRKRFTIAQINAGATLVPALAGVAFRAVDAYAIAVGGAVGATTTVDILATLSAASRKLVAFAQASLTQSALLRAGASGAAILADGASFVKNDAGTAITVGKTGADLTTATHVDIALTYSIE